jgi:hypothetical protein
MMMVMPVMIVAVMVMMMVVPDPHHYLPLCRAAKGSQPQKQTPHENPTSTANVQVNLLKPRFSAFIEHYV